jgi:hypothetical protein
MERPAVGARTHHLVRVIRAQPAGRRIGHSMRGRKIGIVALLVLGTLLCTGFGLGLWAKRQLLDTDWVDTSGKLLEDEEIRAALGTFIVDRVYTSAQVEQRAREILPDRLNPLAGPAAAGFKEIAIRNAPSVLGTAVALDAWREANRKAHDTLLALVNGDLANGALSLNLEQLVEKVATETGLPADVAQRLPPDVAQLQIVRPSQLDTAKEGLDLFEAAVWILLVLTAASFAGAVALSPDRRRTMVTVGGCLIFAGVAVLASRRVAGGAVVDALADAPNANAVADDSGASPRRCSWTWLRDRCCSACLSCPQHGSPSRATGDSRAPRLGSLAARPPWRGARRARRGDPSPRAVGSGPVDPAVRLDRHLHGSCVRVARMDPQAHGRGVP